MLLSNKVICISSPPVSSKFEYDINQEIRGYNNALKKLCIEKSCIFIDIFNKFDTNKSLWSDGLHLNKGGDEIIAKEIEEALEHEQDN